MRQVQQGVGRAEQEIQREQRHARDKQRSRTLASHLPVLRGAGFAVEFGSDQREPDIGRFAGRARCAGQHRPEPGRRSFDANAREAVAKSPRATTAENLAVHVQLMRESVSLIPPRTRPVRHNPEPNSLEPVVG